MTVQLDGDSNLQRLKELADSLSDVENQLERANAYLAAIVEHSEDAILAKDLNGFITSWNPAAERLYGYTSTEAIGQHVSLIVPADKQAELEGVMAQIRNGEGSALQTQRQHKDGHLIDVNLTVSPIKDSKGQLIGASAIAREIDG